MIPPDFRQIWFVDTEFRQDDGERPLPICLCGRELFSGKVLRRWLWDQPSPNPPFEVRPDVLVVCYAATAEWSVFLRAGWPLPCRVVDLHAEYRWWTSGIKLASYGQLAAMDAFGLPHMEEQTKTDMRARCIQGGPFTASERRQILAYCQEDADGVAALFGAMEKCIDWPRALIRGRYTCALARVEELGVPIDGPLYQRLRDNRERVCRELINGMGKQYGVFDEERFDLSAFEDYLTGQGIAWPRTPTGRLATREEVFEEQVVIYPQLRPLYELRQALSRLKSDGGLTIGADSRNRSSLRPFATSSGRNAPSSTQWIFGKSVSFRHLIRPDPGMAISYIDWAQQEFAIASVLSGDENMRRAYLSTDPYLEFAKQAGAVPQSATKETHSETREVFKACMLGTNYSMGEKALARRIRKPPAFARELLQFHRQVYRTYWRWIEQVQDVAMITGRLQTCFGWQVNVGPHSNSRSLRNFMMQATGAEMLRLAACLTVEGGVSVVALVHDAMLVAAPSRHIEEAVRITRNAMAEASRVVLDGFELRTDHKTFHHPQHYRDARGDQFWALLMDVLGRVDPLKSFS
jgi:DNA polymerase I-like protein with 3'-5' exonuclease and polymerase domains